MTPNPISPQYRCDYSGRESSRISDLWNPNKIKESPSSQINDFFSGEIKESSTCFPGITRTLSYARLFAAPQVAATDLESALFQAIEDCLSHSEKPVIALSGGIDSFLLAALAAEVCGESLPLATLVSRIPNYCEWKLVQRLGEELPFIKDIQAVEFDVEDFVAALPDAVAAAEVPFYNLHPVSKFLFAEKIAQSGFRTCLTGDAADQLFSANPDYDYLPVVGAIFAHSDIALPCPFLHPALSPWAGSSTTKEPLRKLAAKYLPDWFLEKPKTPGFAPAQDVSRFRDPEWEISFSNRTGIPQPRNESEELLWTSLSLLNQSHQLDSCAVSAAS